MHIFGQDFDQKTEYFLFEILNFVIPAFKLEKDMRSR